MGGERCCARVSQHTILTINAGSSSIKFSDYVAAAAFPDETPIGCFDAAFHRRHPWVNDAFALPGHLYEDGVRRDGSHGLSDQYVMGELDHLAPEPEAAQAIDAVVFRIRREIGAMAALLGGADVVVFCGGIGEQARSIRARVCDGMDWLGLSLDPKRNAENARDLAKITGRVRIKVILTDEERLIAQAVNDALTLDAAG